MGWRRNKADFMSPSLDLDKQEILKGVEVSTRSKHKTYSHAEIAAQNGELSKDVWIVIGNNVYDVTKFLQRVHPGGPEVIKAFAGRQCDWQGSIKLTNCLR